MNTVLSVAVPWSLSHYIPLNGFHPLYRALFEDKPKWVELKAWDNIAISHELQGNLRFRRDMLIQVQRQNRKHKQNVNRIEKEYFAHFWPPNQALTRLLPGDIEFLHTSPFPSLDRPFVFHCESFAPIFFPFLQQGSGKERVSRDLRTHYKAIFEHPLCLGISSHLPNTLQDISRFFGSKHIDDQLFVSRIGLHTCKSASSVTKGPLDAPVFLFINSADQNPNNFFLRGGHLALRYWQSSYPNYRAGRLFMRCRRPTDSLLQHHGVDLDWLRSQERHSIIWIEEYLSDAELDALMQVAHFLLLPSASLHSVSIMQAMAAGVVPVITDTLGTDLYVRDSVDGIVLKGMLASIWHRDAETKVMVDQYQHKPEVESDLVQQLVRRLGDLLANSFLYYGIQKAALAKSHEAFSGKAFSDNFWLQVQQRYQALPRSMQRQKKSLRNWTELRPCLLVQSDWPRVFASPPQPLVRLQAGRGRVAELGGAFISLNSWQMDLHDWSPLAEFVNNSARSLVFATDIKGLGGSFLGLRTSSQGGGGNTSFGELHF